MLMQIGETVIIRLDFYSERLGLPQYYVPPCAMRYAYFARPEPQHCSTRTSGMSQPPAGCLLLPIWQLGRVHTRGTPTDTNRVHSAAAAASDYLAPFLSTQRVSCALSVDLPEQKAEIRMCLAAI